MFGEKAVYRENVKIEDISKSFFREEYLFAKEVIEGSIQNYNVKICNAILKNSNHFTWNGVAVRLDFKFHLNGIVFVLPTEIVMGQEHETLYKRPAEACRKIETDNIAFNEAYNVYAEDKLDAMRLLNPILIEKFVNAKRCDNEMALYATGNSVYILQRNIYFSEKAFQVPNTEKKVDELKPVNVKNDLKGIYNNAKNLLELINGGM